MNASLGETQRPQPARSGGGNRVLYGCLIAAGVVIALIVVAGVVGYRFLRGVVVQYTSETPVELPSVVWSEDEVDRVLDRIQRFGNAIQAGETPPDLVLTADEINALINRNEKLRGRIYVTIRDGQVSGDVSIPLDSVPTGSGRYFNASATFDVSMTDGTPVVRLVDGEVRGEPVPEYVIAALRNENLAENIDDDPDVRETLRRFESLIVEDDRIILKPRVPNANAAGDRPAPGEAPAVN